MTSDSDSDDDDYDAEVGAQALCNGHHKVISTTLYMVISSALFLKFTDVGLHSGQMYCTWTKITAFKYLNALKSLTFKAKNSHWGDKFCIILCILQQQQQQQQS